MVFVGISLRKEILGEVAQALIIAYMNITEETDKIMSHRLLGFFDSKEYVDWAVRLLISGYESESLLILAGMDNDSTEERERYFNQAIEELQINTTKSRYELINNYGVQYLAELVVNGEINPRVGLSAMFEIIKDTGYNRKYDSFLHIGHDIGFLLSGAEPLFSQGLTKENINEYITRQFQLLIDAGLKQANEKV